MLIPSDFVSSRYQNFSLYTDLALPVHRARVPSRI
jgi:hypothetical protein